MVADGDRTSFPMMATTTPADVAERQVVNHGVSSFSFSQAIEPDAPRGVALRQTLKRMMTPPGRGHSRIERSCEQLACMVRPVTVILVGVVVYAAALRFDARGSPPLREKMPYERAAGDGAGAIAWGSTLNALYLMVYVVGCTLLFVVLFKYRLRKTLLALLTVLFGGVIGGFFAYLCYRALKAWRVPFDAVAFVLLCVNFAAVGVALIFWDIWAVKAPLANIGAKQGLATKGFLLFKCAGLTLPFMYMDEWTVWAFLVAMVVWDLFAVLTPCGPLRYVMLIHQQRLLTGDEFEMPPGMVYEGTSFTLGTGDFVFYAAVAARAAVAGYVPAAATLLSIVFAVLSTVYTTVRSRHDTLPALPIAVVVGVFMFFTSKYLLAPYVDAMARGALYA